MPARSTASPMARRAPPARRRRRSGTEDKRRRSTAPLLPSDRARNVRPLRLAIHLAAASLLLAAAINAAVAQSFEERLSVCLACHGEKGQSENAEVPSLGA